MPALQGFVVVILPLALGGTCQGLRVGNVQAKAIHSA
jgi:hypothetical protein